MCGSRFASAMYSCSVVDAERAAHADRDRRHGEHADRREVGEAIARRLLQHEIAEQRAVLDQDRQAVGRRLGNVGGGDRAGGAGLGFDDHRLAPGFGQFHADEPHHRVVTAAGGGRNDDVDRRARVAGLRPSGRREQRGRGQAGEGLQGAAAGQGHVLVSGRCSVRKRRLRGAVDFRLWVGCRSISGCRSRACRAACGGGDRAGRARRAR